MSLLWWYSYPTRAWNKFPRLISAHSSSSRYSDILIVEKLSTDGLTRWLMTLWPLRLTYHSGLFKLCCLLGQIGSSRQESKWLFNSVFVLPDTRQSSSDDCLIQSQQSSLSLSLGNYYSHFTRWGRWSAESAERGCVTAGVQAGWLQSNLHIILLTTEGTST